MKSVCYLSLFLMLITACSAAPNSIFNQPTADQYLALLSGLNLESMLTKLGGPAYGYDLAKVSSILPDMFTGIPQPINQIYLEFDQTNAYPDNPDTGGAAIIVYSTTESARKAFTILAQGMEDSKDVQDIGEQGQMTTDDINFAKAELVFLRCTTVVHIRITDVSFWGPSAPQTTTSYGQKLDETLANLVCR